MPAVVSDTSPLILLACIGRLDWLRALYGGVVIPDAVWREFGAGTLHRPEIPVVHAAVAAGWMQIQSVRGEAPLAVGVSLDPGETEAIQLARKLNAILVIDELAGRQVAEQLGIQITGTAGVLLRARLLGLTDNLTGELDRLRTETTFWFADDLRDELLRRAGELK